MFKDSRKGLQIQTSHQKKWNDSDRLSAPLGKIICVGDYTGKRDKRDKKGVFIEDYLQVRRQLPLTENRTTTTRVGRYFKMIRWQRKVTENPFLIKLHLQILEVAESDLNAEAIYCKFSFGALVLWEASNPSLLDGATKWRQNIGQFLSSIPCVLVTDNTAKPGQESLQWIGPGEIFESELALHQFCKEHGFVDHFEIKLRDWESGEKSVFGEAVNCLLGEIFHSESNTKKEAWVVG